VTPSILTIRQPDRRRPLDTNAAKKAGTTGPARQGVQKAAANEAPATKVTKKSPKAG
jgi:hypothetical protein